MVVGITQKQMACLKSDLQLFVFRLTMAILLCLLFCSLCSSLGNGRECEEAEQLNLDNQSSTDYNDDDDDASRAWESH